MIVLPPYIYDREVYPLIPAKHRWLMNKLQLAERLGYECGPTGVKPPPGRDLCVRPMMNIFGFGEGGFYKFNSTTPGDLEGLKNRPGYFWCEWFNGPRTYTEFINDVPVYSIGATTSGTGVNKWRETSKHIIMPDFVKNISRYILLESVGNKIIEVSLRLMGANARLEPIIDYRTIDPSYNPTDIQFGLRDSNLIPAKPFEVKGWQWTEKENS